MKKKLPKVGEYWITGGAGYSWGDSLVLICGVHNDVTRNSYVDVMIVDGKRHERADEMRFFWDKKEWSYTVDCLVRKVDWI